MQKRTLNYSVLSTLLFTISVVSICFLSPQASASGSYSPKAGGANRSANNQYYNYGKKAVQQKLLCASCPLSNININSTQARQIIQSLNGGTSEISKSLTRREKQSVSIYLKRRFNL